MATMTAATVPPDIAHAVTEWGRSERDALAWRGKSCQQFPADLWRYAQLCWELNPAFAIEVGAFDGGTALYLADVLSLRGDGFVISIDIDPQHAVQHDRVEFLSGDSVAGPVTAKVRELAAGRRGLVLLDGNHDGAQVLKELELYAELASYLIVEDTIMRWLPGYGYGPHEALDVWLPKHPEFRADPDPVPGPTQHPGGWLRRVD